MAARPERLFARLRRDRPAGEDATLLTRFARGRDGEAFARLVGRHGPTVVGVCRRILRDPAAADDAAQAVFVVLARSAGRLPRRVNLGGWLYAVAVNVALKARRSAARREARERRAARPDVDRGPGPEAAARRRELAAVLDEELARLPTPHRDAIVLCDIQGRSQDEAAELLGRPRGTVAVHLARGRERLRRRLSARGWSGTGAALSGLAVFIPGPLAAACVTAAVSGAAPAAVRRLVKRYTREVFAMKALMWTAVVLVLGLGLLVGALLDRDGPAAVTEAVAAPKAAPEKATYAFLYGESVPKKAKAGEFRAGINVDYIEWYVGDADGKKLRKLQDGKGKRLPVRPVDRTVILNRDDDGVTLLGPDGADLTLSLKTGPLADAKIKHDGQRTTFSFGPDGKMVAFVNAAGDLCRIALGPKTLAVTKGGGLNASNGVHFTPDGKRIAYSKYRQLDDYGKATHGVYVADADGGNEKRVFEGPALAGFGFLPDGRVGVVDPSSVRAFDPTTGKAEVVSGPWPRKLPLRSFGGFNPDGTTFFYDTGGPYVLSLYSFNLKTRAVTTVKANHLESFQEMVWVRVGKEKGE